MPASDEVRAKRGKRRVIKRTDQPRARNATVPPRQLTVQPRKADPVRARQRVPRPLAPDRNGEGLGAERLLFDRALRAVVGDLVRTGTHPRERRV